VGQLPDGVRRHAGLVLGIVQGVLLYVLPVGLEAAGRALDKGAVVEPLCDDLPPDRVSQGDVRTDVDTEPEMGPLGGTGTAGVDGEEAGAAADAFKDMVEEDGVGLAGVGAPEDDEVGVFNFLIRAGAASCSENRRQTDDAGGVSGAVAGVDVVGADDLPGELLGEVVDFVGRLGAGEEAEGGWAPRCDGFAEAAGRTVEGLVPGRGSERAVLTDQGLGEAGQGRHRSMG